MKLPKSFEDRMKELLEEEFPDYLACLEQKHHSGIRVNTLKITPEEFEKISPFPVRRIPWIPNGYFYEGTKQPARHPYYYAGLYYIQEPSAMTPASFLPVSPGDKVLDLCGAPGGKSTELAAKLKGEGLLVSNDVSNSRAKALLKNLELFGTRNAVVLSETPEALTRHFEEYFDKILVDAPCSGEGMFRKSPGIMRNWEQYGVDYYNKLQKEILLQAVKMLKPGGYLLYSTCTFSPEEDEGTVTYLLEQCPEFHIADPFAKADHKMEELTFDGFAHGRPEWVEGPEDLKNCIRLWPHRIPGEGHFIALLQKEEGYSTKLKADTYYNYNAEDLNDTWKEGIFTPARKKMSHKTRAINRSANMSLRQKGERVLSEEAEDFLRNLGMAGDLQTVEAREDRLYLAPEELPDLGRLRIMRQGLFLGEMKKNRFEPSQALAMALNRGEYAWTIDLSSDNPDTVKYLKGETISVTGDYRDGWNLVCVDGYPLGWGKLMGQTLKNKYLPGWRWM